MVEYGERFGPDRRICIDGRRAYFLEGSWHFEAFELRGFAV